MKRIALLFLAFALLFSACGRTTPAPIPETTTEIATTTEAPTTTATFVPTSGESNGVRWRVLDLDDETNLELRAWLEENGTSRENDKERKYKLSDTKTVFERRQIEGPNDIFLRDKTTGKEALLIEGDKGKEDPLDWYNPFISEVLDERYFVYEASGYEWPAGCGVYDTKRLQKIPVQQPSNTIYAGVYNSAIYLQDFVYDGTYHQMQAYVIPLENLDIAEKLLPGENLLEGIPEADLGETCCYGQLFSPGKRFFVIKEESAVRIFDLHSKSFMCRVSVNGIKTNEYSQHFPIAFRNEHTLYCYDDTIYVDRPNDKIQRYALEITLP